MFIKNKTRLTPFIYPRPRIFPGKPVQKLGERGKRKRNEHINGWKRPDRAKLKLCTDSETLGRFTNSSILHSPIHTNRGLSTSSSLHYPIQQRSSVSVQCWTICSFFASISILDVQSSLWIRQNPGRGDSWSEDRYNAFKSGWCVRVWPIASKLEIVPVNNASRGLETWRRKRSLV